MGTSRANRDANGAGATSARGGAGTAAGETARGLHAYLTMRDLIVAGRLSPGTRLSENELSLRLGMSRTPVRSALQRLRGEGYILVQGAGRSSRTLVAPLTREDARELFDVMAALEGAAARVTAALDPAPRRRVVERMRRLNAELRALARLRRPDPDRRFRNDRDFHRCFVEVAGPRLRALHDAVNPQSERYIHFYISRLLVTSVTEHVAIADAVATGDPERAQRAVEANWRNAAERLTRVIDVAGEQGSW